MAKPMHTASAGCKTTPQDPPSPQINAHHRRRRRRRKPPSSSGPSPALLSILATIAASSSVHGSPAPLPFLCPSLQTEDVPQSHPRPRAAASSRRASRSQDFPRRSSGSTRHVPDKYEIDENGRWRRVDAYTLYGSTVCPNCYDPTNSVTSIDDQIQGPAGSSTSPDTGETAMADYDIRDTLPPGWKPSTKTQSSRTPLILALSLVLAFFICFLIIGCLFWRKSKRRKRRQDTDIEMRARRRRRNQTQDDDSTRGLAEATQKEVRVKQKIWARATARWKANARYSARQRRGKRIASTTRMTSPQNSSISLDQPPDAQRSPQIAALSPPLSRRSSMESLYADPSLGDPAHTPSSPHEDGRSQHTAPPIPSSHPPPPPRTSPPAYHQRVPVPQIVISSTGSDGDQLTSSPLSPPTRRSSFSSRCPSDPTDTATDPELPPQPLHAAHVATDDKALLARMADLASAPPEDATNSSSYTNTTVFEVSAPVWEDEELEDFSDHHPYDPESNIPASDQSTSTSSTAPLFPPPPSKGKMAAAFYDYPYAFEDITGEPEPGPSAPPFEEEESSSLPEMVLTASAPPLSEADAVYYTESYASAPPNDWDDTEAHVTSCEAGDGNQLPHDEDITSTADRPQSDSGLHTPPTDTSTPPVQGPVGSDGTPPCYHP
ncbi:hypothetical protein Hypma_015923 [Hypsizygus marmoreus]|uniref:Uncharacterized protein n=1 Tax=Hypsizygus marmoreus TaxID=39966 RepID=A0A369K4E8_HYPMA|nr:hypothetical protein Hypma_015923 [Hypsizygus marmoreus]